MNNSKEYGGLDYFRIIAAILVVAIHTSPLSIFSESADFVFTRIICRVAVPFFFMVSGYFLYSYQSKMMDKVNHFVKKTSALYGIAILLCLPLNIYNGYFQTKPLLTKIIKDILFDGTLYHLWYLPAAIIGAYIVLLLLAKCKEGQALLITAIFYLIGLFGDSYYGIASKIGPLKELYNIIFQISDYTRNGIFYAPIFLILGGLIARHRKSYLRYNSLHGMIISTSLMLIEGMSLYYFKLQRHDSMYLMLLPCMFFLFQIILQCNIRTKPMLRKISMLIYIIHPLSIVFLRGIAKFLKLEGLLIDNSLIYYLTVLGISSAAAILYINLSGLLYRKHIGINRSSRDKMGRAWLNIDLSALESNVKALKSITPNGCNIMAIVKANAYGHGDYEIATHLNKIGINAFGVATIDEGIALRKHRVKGDILVMGFTDPARVSELHQYKLMQAVIDYDYAKKLNRSKEKIQVHLKIDTGMHRIGLHVNEVDRIEELFSYTMLDIQGIFTHLCVADSLTREDIIYTKGQINAFYELISILKERGVTLPKIHLQSSYGLLNYPDLYSDYVRIGIALYGTLSSPSDKTRVEVHLHPVLSLKVRVAMLQEIKEGEQAGYGRNFTAKRNSCLAVLPIGYADGLPRSLSCKAGRVLLHGQYAPIVGRICMDQLIIDVTDIPNVKPGDIATLIGRDGDKEVTAAEVANNSASITNELLSRLGRRLERIYL